MSNGAVMKVQLKGEFTVRKAGKYSGNFLKLSEKVDELTIDLSQVSEVDSAAIQLLFSVKKEFHNRGIPLTFIPTSAMLETAEILGFPDFLH